MLKLWENPMLSIEDRLEVASEEIERLHSQLDAARYEHYRASARVEGAAQLLTGIHSLLYPAPIKAADGRMMAFRPKSIDPHEVLQELSDRIRALPDELRVLSPQMGRQELDLCKCSSCGRQLI
jgi:uncharacterized small protein (DUF1192 family)